MTWSFDITTAPRDGGHIILAMTNGTTLRSYWCTPKHEPDHWCMLSHKNEPLAWMPWPKHPNANAPEGETDASGNFERDKAQSVPAHLTDSNTVAGGSSCSAHFILDDCGSGA